jgi:hypothetical protein
MSPRKYPEWIIVFKGGEGKNDDYRFSKLAEEIAKSAEPKFYKKENKALWTIVNGETKIICNLGVIERKPNHVVYFIQIGYRGNNENTAEEDFKSFVDQVKTLSSTNGFLFEYSSRI